MRAQTRPDPYEPSAIARASGLAIVISAFCVAAAIVILFLASSSIAASQNASSSGIVESARATELTQRVLQDLITLANDRQSGAATTAVHADLNTAATDLDSSISTLSDAATGHAYDNLSALHESWSPIRADLARLGSASSNELALGRAVRRTLAFDSQLAEGVTAARAQLADDAVARAEEGSAWRRLASTILLVALAILALAIAARLSDTAREWQRFAEMLERTTADLAKGALRLDRDRRSQGIVMEALADGMFGLSRDLRVVPPFARELCPMFGVRDVTGMSVRELLKPLVSERRLHEIDDYLEELYRVDISDDFVARENPMTELEIATGGDDGHRARYLEFSFRRVRDGNRISHVFVSIEDVSQRVREARELARAIRRRERQEALVSLTSRVSSDRLAIFLAEADFEAKRMSDAIRPEDMALASRGYIEILRERLGSLVLATGRLKRLAHGVGFFYLFDLASAFEKRIAEVRRMSYVDGDAFLALVVMQADLRAEIEEVHAFRRNVHDVAS